MPNADDSAPWGVYPCRGGWCAIEAATDEHWQYLTVAMGHPELMAYPDYVSAELRVKNRAAVDAHVRAVDRDGHAGRGGAGADGCGGSGASRGRAGRSVLAELRLGAVEVEGVLEARGGPLVAGVVGNAGRDELAVEILDLGG